MRLTNELIHSGKINGNGNIVSGTISYLHIEAVPGTRVTLSFSDNDNSSNTPLLVGQTGILELAFDENLIPNKFSIEAVNSAITYYTYISVALREND